MQGIIIVEDLLLLALLSLTAGNRHNLVQFLDELVFASYLQADNARSSLVRDYFGCLSGTIKVVSKFGIDICLLAMLS